MLLSLTTTRAPATDLSWLLHKHPDRVQSFELTFGRAHVFYPENTPERCTLALLLDVDPIGLSRKSHGATAPLEPYVNDRPYVASSFLSVAIAEVLGTALAGRCKDRPELVDERLPLEATLPAVPCHGGDGLLRRLFEPLGWTVEATRLTLDEQHPEWGEGAMWAVKLSGTSTLRELLAQLYVLVPVLDDEKHYWVGDDEVEKLLRHGEGWLADHPEKELVASRYLKHRTSLARAALARLGEDERAEIAEVEKTRAEEAIEKPINLNTRRMREVLGVLRAEGVRSVLDLGCGEGRLVKALADDRSFERVVGVEVSHRALEIAERRLDLEHLSETKRARVDLLHGSLLYRDARLSGFDAAVVVEVIEHLDPSRVGAFERVLFEHTRPRLIVLTTPNAEYNVRFPGLSAGAMRHADHRFEWTRAELRAWADGVAKRTGYEVGYLPVGEVDAEVGPPTQMAVFRRADGAVAAAAAGEGAS